MNLVKSLRNFKLPSAFLLIITGLFLYQSILVNIDVSSGRHILLMDELITFDGVKAIFEASSFKKLKYFLLDGGDNRYGRILWNFLAFFSYGPYKIWGDQGLIISNRMILSLSLIISYFLLTISFLRSNYLRLVAVASMILLPTTIYFQFLPKPEPIQLLFITTMLILFSRGKDCSAWFMAGLSLGAKVSFLPGLIYILIAGIYKTSFKQYVMRLFCLWGGLVIAVPILFKFKFNQYLQSTLLDTVHGSDDSRVNFFSWISFVFNDYLGRNIFYSLFLLLFLVLFLHFLKQKLTSREELFKILEDRGALFHSILALSFLIPVMLFTRRHWDHYLHLGFVLLILSLGEFWEHLKFKYKDGVNKWLMVLAIISLVAFVPRTVSYSKVLMSRSKAEGYKKKVSLYSSMIEFFDKTEGTQEGVVCIDPNLFYPLEYKQYKFRPFWGFFSIWDENCNYIILTDTQLKQKVPPTNLLYSEYIKFHVEFKLHVLIKDGNKCYSSSCYRKIKKSFSDEVIVLCNVKL